MSDQPTEVQPPDAEAQPESVEEPTESFIERLGVINIIRLTVGAFGLAGFVVGVIIAWHSRSATTLLIVSVVLLVLAALGLDWNKIRGTYAGWTVELLRNVGDRIEQVAAGGDVPEAVREELESLRAEVKALTPARRRRSLPPLNSAALDDLMKTGATHSFRGTDSVQLSMRRVTVGDGRYRCTVKTPSRSAYSAVTRRPIMAVGVPVYTYTVIYPEDFAGSEPLRPGRYEVEWREAPLVDPFSPGTTPLAAALALTTGPTIATDSFTIPERTTV